MKPFSAYRSIAWKYHHFINLPQPFLAIYFHTWYNYKQIDVLVILVEIHTRQQNKLITPTLRKTIYEPCRI